MKIRNPGLKWRYAIVIIAVALMFPGYTMAQKRTCAYVNDNYFREANTVDGYLVEGTSATYLSPVLTGGTSLGDFGYSDAVTESVMHPILNILYVSDDESHDIAAMKIDPHTCLLELLGNYSVDGNDGHGIDLAISPNGKWLYAANTTAPNVELFYIRADGSLNVRQQLLELPDIPAGMAVSPDGTTLVIAFPASLEIVSYSIDQATGSLMQVSSVKVGNEPEGITIDSLSKYVYAGTFNYHAERVEQLEIGPGSTLTSVADKAVHEGLNASSVLLAPTGKYLFVSNSLSGTVTTFRVNKSTGAISFEYIAQDGPSGNLPANLATDESGNLLFSGSDGPGGGGILGIFSVSADGSLVSLGTFYVAQGLGDAYPTSVVSRTF